MQRLLLIKAFVTTHAWRLFATALLVGANVQLYQLKEDAKALFGSDNYTRVHMDLKHQETEFYVRDQLESVRSAIRLNCH